MFVYIQSDNAYLGLRPYNCQNADLYRKFPFFVRTNLVQFLGSDRSAVQTLVSYLLVYENFVSEALFDFAAVWRGWKLLRKPFMP